MKMEKFIEDNDLRRSNARARTDYFLRLQRGEEEPIENKILELEEMKRNKLKKQLDQDRTITNIV